MERFLKSKFRIGGKINEGPFSLTYKGTTLSGEQPVIIKIYKRGTLNSMLIKSMKQKVKILSEIDHPNLARLLDGDYGWQGFYYVREFIEGYTLSEYVKMRRFDLFEAEKFILTIAEAIKLAHDKGIVHGALKMTNILITREAGPKITDFVIEGEIRESLTQKANLTLRSDPSLTPEELLGCPADRSSDIYNLGVILASLAKGAPLFEDSSSQFSKVKQVPALPAGLPRYVEEILVKALQPDPILRFKSVDDLIESLKHRTLVEASGVKDWPLIEMENSPRPEEKAGRVIKSERKRSFFLLIVVLLATLAGVLYSLINSYFLRQ
jgi:serine/threonine-protein kinase